MENGEKVERTLWGTHQPDVQEKFGLWWEKGYTETEIAYSLTLGYMKFFIINIGELPLSFMLGNYNLPLSFMLGNYNLLGCLSS